MRTLLLTLSLFFFIKNPTLKAIDCSATTAAIGPCMECELSWGSVKESLAAPPLYWDVCRDQGHFVIHYFPLMISPQTKDGKPLVSLRKSSNGELILDALLSFSSPPDVEAIKKEFPRAKFLSPVPETIQIEFLGRVNEWIQTKRFDAPSLLDVTKTMKLRMIFKKEKLKEAEELFKRPVGLIGKIILRYKGYTKKGVKMPFDYTLAIHVGVNNQEKR